MTCNYNDIYNAFISAAAAARSEIILISAFITSDIVAKIYENIHEDIKTTVICRYLKQDLLFGSSDLRAAKIILEHGGRLLRNPSLHAKLFMFDKDILLFGSSNLTSKGMGLIKDSNIECMSYPLKVSAEDIFFVNALIASSQVVDNPLLVELQKQIDSDAAYEYDEKRINDMAERLRVIFINDFPFSKYPDSVIGYKDDPASIHDLQLLQVNSKEVTMDIIKLQYTKTKIVNWLNVVVRDQIQFGELSALIHNALLDDPKPYRKEIKELQRNLLNWIEYLLPETYKIYIPEGYHSQVVKKIC